MTKTNLPSSPLSSAGTGTNSLRDIRPPVEIPNGWAWLIWTLGILAVAALLALAWWRWRQKRPLAPPIPVVPPHVRARQQLEAALALIGKPKEFCIAVSDAARWYLEERFDFRAPERTTEEFLHELTSTDRLTPDQKNSLGEFLQRCDLVKFARYEPGEPELRELHAAAIRLVDETEPPALTSTQAETATAAGAGAIPPAATPARS